MENTEFDFMFSCENNADGCYLVLKIDDETKLLNHQVEILCQNPNPAFLPFYIKRENDSTCICYNITSKISLSQYIERKNLNKKELLDLLRSITKNLMLYGNYLLNLSGFIIHSDFVFINPATAEVSLLYIPVTCDRNSMDVLRSFFKDIVVNSSNADDNARDNYLQRILNYIKSDTFSIFDFNRLIMDLRNSGELFECGKGADNQDAAAEADIPYSKSLKEKADEDAEKSKKIRSIILLQPLFLIVAVIICLLMALKQMSDITSITGVVLITAALDILVINKISGNQDNGTAKDNRIKEIINDNKHMSKDKSKSNEGRRYKQAFSYPDVVKACDTIIISEAQRNRHPYLESIGTNRVERIIINKNKFRIGRLGSMVDHIIHGNTIGKLHAEITINEGLYSIKDLNSKNGTFVNGVRIPNNKEYEIKENDMIRFSNYEYVFKRQQGQ